MKIYLFIFLTLYALNHIQLEYTKKELKGIKLKKHKYVLMVFWYLTTLFALYKV